MKTGIHPEIHQDATITCTACGAVFMIPGTKKEIHIEICSQCHPVYTGQYRKAVSSGRVERFQKKLATAKKTREEARPKKKRLSAEERLEQRLEEKRTEKARREEKKLEKAKKEAAATTKKTAKPAATKKAPARKSGTKRGGTKGHSRS